MLAICLPTAALDKAEPIKKPQIVAFGEVTHEKHAFHVSCNGDCTGCIHMSVENITRNGSLFDIISQVAWRYFCNTSGRQSLKQYETHYRGSGQHVGFFVFHGIE